MVIPQRNLWAQGIGRLIIQHEFKYLGHECTEVWGEIEVNIVANVNAVDLRLKKLENLQLTPGSSDAQALANDGHDITATKTIYNKERKNNNASIYLWDISGGAVATGSHYVNFLAMGE